MEALLDNSITKWAFNAAFERICLSRYLWDMGRLKRGQYIDPRGWRCDMVWAGYMGFPMNLKGAGAALQLDEHEYFVPIATYARSYSPWLYQSDFCNNLVRRRGGLAVTLVADRYSAVTKKLA